MIDCSTDRWAGISIDDASTLHSVACTLHFSAVIIVISPGLKCGNATRSVTKLMALGEAVMKANSAWLLLIRGIQYSLFKMDQYAGALPSDQCVLPSSDCLGSISIA